MKENHIEDIARLSLLYDFYGALLSDKQREVMELYHEENLSLMEIAEESGVSRQAVHDSLKKAEQALNDYEKKLGLVEKLVSSRQIIRDIEHKIDDLEKIVPFGDEHGEIIKELNSIKDIISKLEE